jgi:hypothetical protein
MAIGYRTYVVSSEVVDVALGEHGVVLKLGLAERGSVSGNDDKLGFSGTESLKGRLVSEDELSGLHNKRKARVDGVGAGLLGLLGGGFIISISIFDIASAIRLKTYPSLQFSGCRLRIIEKATPVYVVDELFVVCRN